MRTLAEIRDQLAQPLDVKLIVETTNSMERVLDLADQLQAWREDARGLLAEVGRLALRDDQVIVPAQHLRTLRNAGEMASDLPGRIKYVIGKLNELLEEHNVAFIFACENPPERPHLIGGEFQSDKYPTTPRGKVPLSVKDPLAQDLLWIYAHRRRAVDADFSADLETALKGAGFEPPKVDAEYELTESGLAAAARRDPDGEYTALREMKAYDEAGQWREGDASLLHLMLYAQHAGDRGLVERLSRISGQRNRAEAMQKIKAMPDGDRAALALSGYRKLAERAGLNPERLRAVDLNLAPTGNVEGRVGS